MKTNYVSHFGATALVLGIWLLGTVVGQCYFNVDRAIADSLDGQAASQCDFNALDELTAPTGPPRCTSHPQFSTKYQDNETDPFFHGYRYYNASTGRWLSRDPSDEIGGPNVYGFVAGNPLVKVDADGREIGNICPHCGQYYIGTHNCALAPCVITIHCAYSYWILSPVSPPVTIALPGTAPLLIIPTVTYACYYTCIIRSITGLCPAAYRVGNPAGTRTEKHTVMTCIPQFFRPKCKPNGWDEVISFETY